MWTEIEIKIVLKAIAAGLKPVDIQHALPSRSLSAITVKMCRLRSNKQAPWSHEEREILREFYGRVSSQDLLELLPGRTKGSIRGQVSYLRKRGWQI